MRKVLLVVLLSLILEPSSFAYCNSLPRLICAEYANSNAVVEAKLLATKHHVPPNGERQDWYIYTLESTKVHKGKIDKEFRVHEENDSGRAGFFWKKGQSYLLFLRQGDDGTWWLYGCGNSKPLRESESILKVIESMKPRNGGYIQGLVRVGNTGEPMRALTVEIKSAEQSYKTVTDPEGKFGLHVKAGQYKLQIHFKGWSFGKDKLESYEDPADIRIETGGCAQLVILGDLKQ